MDEADADAAMVEIVKTLAPIVRKAGGAYALVAIFPGGPEVDHDYYHFTTTLPVEHTVKLLHTAIQRIGWAADTGPTRQ